MSQSNRRLIGYAVWTLALVMGSYGAWRTHVESSAREAHNEARDAAFWGLIESSQYATAILDSEGKVLNWSPAAARLTGWSENEMLGRDVSRLMPDDKVAEHRQGYAEAARAAEAGIWNKKVLSVDCRIIRKSGRDLPVEVRTRFFVSKGEPTISFSTIVPKSQIIELERDQ